MTPTRQPRRAVHGVLLLDKPVVALYCFNYGGKFYLYQAGFDTGYGRYSVGLSAVGLTIRL